MISTTIGWGDEYLVQIFSIQCTGQLRWLIKMEVVNVLDRESVSVRHLAKRFNIGKTQAAEIAKNKEDIRSKWQSGTNINQKKDFLKKEE
ncbi:unnamed protein product [Acanthoscelides obtectus]|uniref:HTH psq-type domain-containing protein n=1 Tax=Acanthoscelides obtectus TaxID=200917 RepID=A0A9P0Q4R2_ACAOB|nr:unnamed protein product [Acanthoscelides obtectus]CAK1627265.1 hypothetical protein AOBTE_LOCUS4450 [Acanthoscelides obtectus]